MPIYLYCLLAKDADAEPTVRAGIDGHSVRRIEEAGLHAWVSEMREPSLTPTLERAKAHDSVVSAVMARETPVPARFGQLFSSEVVLRETLSLRASDLRSSLDRVRGAVEMTVRALLGDRAKLAGDEQHDAESGALTASDSRGRAYMERLADRERVEQKMLVDGASLRRRIRDAVQAVIREECAAHAPPSHHLLTVSHLVARSSVRDYRDSVRALLEHEPALRLMVSGPWAPYSFVELAHE